MGKKGDLSNFEHGMFVGARRAHDNEFTVLKWPPQSPDLNPIVYFTICSVTGIFMDNHF